MWLCKEVKSASWQIMLITSSVGAWVQEEEIASLRAKGRHGPMFSSPLRGSASCLGCARGWSRSSHWLWCASTACLPLLSWRSWTWVIARATSATEGSWFGHIIIVVLPNAKSSSWDWARLGLTHAYLYSRSISSVHDENMKESFLLDLVFPLGCPRVLLTKRGEFKRPQ